MENFPAISVIIPLYNAEKYISECLDSILAQTFQNFEVIVVDDCSTDKSCEIVQSYAEKFGIGRLILSHMNKNSGSGALPRNKGMQLSRGEYLAFIDNDDMFTPTAFEELYTLAKNYDADVVYCEKHYTVEGGTELKIRSDEEQGVKLIDEPTFEPEDLDYRVKKILEGKYRVPQWRKLVRRNLIFEYEIFFPHCRISDDDIWTYGVVFYAKKFLRVPNITYIRQIRGDSLSLTRRTPRQVINFWLNPPIFGLKALDNLMVRHEFFQQNPQLRHAVLERFLSSEFSVVLKESLQLSAAEFYETIKQEFGDKFGDWDVLISALYAYVNTLQKVNFLNVEKMEKFIAQTQRRISELEKADSENKAYIAELENFIISLNGKV